ncbi:MAG: DUF3108 domain-containing protein [Gemmatimonadales bacterium]
MPVLTLLVQALLLTRLTAPFPFAVGETLRYEARLGMFPIGTASVTVSSMARERGKEAFVFNATGQGGPPGLRARYDLTSWVSTTPFNSLRFNRRLVQGNSVEEEHYLIIPDSSRYRIEGKPEDWVAPSDPLDELAFLYYLRTIPMKVGSSYQIPRYFKTGYNPIQVRVVARDTARLPSGQTVPVLVVEASSRGTTMGVRFTDDARRLPVQLDLPLPYGSVTLELTGGP